MEDYGNYFEIWWTLCTISIINPHNLYIRLILVAKFGDNPLVLEAIFFCYSFLQRISCFCYQANILLVVAELQIYKLGNSVDLQKSFVYF